MDNVIIPEDIEDQVEILSDLIEEEQEAKARYDMASRKVRTYKTALYEALNKRLHRGS